MQLVWLTIIMLSLSAPSAFAGSAAEETIAKPKLMGVFKGSYRDSYPQAIVVKRFLIHNAAYSVKSANLSDADTIQKMNEKVINDFIMKGTENCRSTYYVIEQVDTDLDYHPDGGLLIHADANVVCLNSAKPL